METTLPTVIFFLFLGLTVDEKSELERLRNEIKKYREMESANTNEETHSQKSFESVKLIFNFRMRKRFKRNLMILTL